MQATTLFDQFGRPTGVGDALIISGGDLPLWVVQDISVAVDPRAPKDMLIVRIMAMQQLPLQAGQPTAGLLRVLTTGERPAMAGNGNGNSEEPRSGPRLVVP